MRGKLFVVATPIGNLGDITLRAIDTLKSSSFILCEDTRVSKVLMDKYDIQTTLVSYRDQNHAKMLPKVIEKLDLGLNLSLITDAGTPLVSDPGFKLVTFLKTHGYDVVPLPGADAVTCAISVSGLPSDRYAFLGFLPKSDTKIKEILKEYGKLEATLCIYESPKRLLKLLKEIYETLGDRKVCVANDLTKLYEEVVTDSVQKVIDIYEKKSKIVGEFVVLVSKE